MANTHRGGFLCRLTGGIALVGLLTAGSPVAQGTARPMEGLHVEGDRDPVPDRLSGRWLMTLPAGFRYQVVLRQVAENRYSLEKAVRFSGVYELRGKHLVLVKPLDPTESGFVWELHFDEELKLAAQPPKEKLGQNYLGATLRRPRE